MYIYRIAELSKRDGVKVYLYKGKENKILGINGEGNVPYISPSDQEKYCYVSRKACEKAAEKTLDAFAGLLGHINLYSMSIIEI